MSEIDIENREWQRQEKENGKGIKKPWADPASEVIIIPSGISIASIPPVEQTEVFQEEQFTKNLPGRGSHLGAQYGDRGTDPIRYEQFGQMSSSNKEKLARNANVGLAKSKKKKLKKAEKSLKGHENKKEILDILRSEWER